MPERMGTIKGPRHVLLPSDGAYPACLARIAEPPETLYVVGSTDALAEGLAVVGARKATPYGRGAAARFAHLAASRGIPIISGGARGCDAAAHRAALRAGAPTVVFLGGGCDRPYPKENIGLFQEVVAEGGALVSEHDWTVPPLPFMFRARNRLIAGLAKATLIVEAGLPSGTFSTADEALRAGRDVLVVPGSIDSPQSRGANRLIYQGATPIVDDDAFADQLFSLFGLLKQERALEGDGCAADGRGGLSDFDQVMIDALKASALTAEQIHDLACSSTRGPWSAADTSAWMSKMVAKGIIARYPGGRFGAQM